MIEAQTHLTTMFLLFILISCYFGVASSSYCPLNEYRAGTECCPSCPPGCHVVKDCTESIITKCSSCPGGTFQAGYNEQKQCSTCTKCDAGLGLKVKKSCTSKSDAVCEVLDGFFCSDSNGGGCRTAQRHRLSCSAGHYIGQRGTAVKDTECLPCTDGTFSDGTRPSCKNHTKCDSVGGVQIQPGTDSTDSTCIHYVVIGVIIIGCITLTSIIALGALIFRRRLKRKKTLEQKRGLTEYANRINKMETPEQRSNFYGTTPLRSTDGPEPTRDQQECTTTTPDGTMDDHHGDQSLGPAPPSSPTDNGSVSVSVHQKDHQPVLIKRDSGASRYTLLSLGLPSTSRSSLLSLGLPSSSPSSLLSLGLPSASQSARRFRFRSKSLSSCLENPKLPTDLLSLLMDNNVADEEVSHDQPESESDDSNSLKPVPIRRDHGVSQVTPLSLSARRCRVRSKSVSSHFNIPRPRCRASLLKGNDIAEEEEWPVLENLD